MPPAARPGPALALALSLLLALAAAAARPLPAGGEGTRGAVAGAQGSPFEVEKYLGRWYQVYGSPSVMETFEKGGEDSNRGEEESKMSECKAETSV